MAIKHEYKEHRCEENISYLSPCDNCIEKDKECPLSVKGICSICGEVIE